MKTQRYAWAALLTALTLSLFGYDFGLDPNLAQVLPFINKLADPSLYPADPFLSSFSSFPSLYPHAAAMLGRLIPMGTLHFAAYLAARFIFLSLTFAMAETLTGSRRTAFAAALLAAVSVQTVILTPLGEDPLLKASFYQSSLAGLLCVFSLLAFLREKYASAFAALGAALFVNALPALYLAVMYAFAYRGAPDTRAMRRGWVVFAVLAAVAAGWLLTLHNNFGGPGPEYSALLKRWYPGHYFPSGWSAEKWFRIAVFLPLNLLLIYGRAAGSPRERTVRSFMCAFYAMWGVALVAGELLPIARLINLQFLRSDAFFCLLGTIFAADFLRSVYQKDEPGGWALGALVVLSFMEPGVSAFPLFTLGLLLARRFGPAWAFRAAALAGGLSCLSALTAHTGPPEHKTAVCLLLFALAAFSGKTFKSAVPARYAALMALAAVLIPYLPVINYRISARTLSNYSGETGSWTALQEWAKDNTPKDALFIVPPDTYGFRVVSRRSPVVEWMDAGAMHWAPGFETQWARRIADMGADSPEGPGRGYSGLTAGDIAGLAGKYGASYVARRANAPLPFRQVYANRDFSLYAVPRSISPNKPS